MFPSITYAAATASTSTKKSMGANPDTTFSVDARGPCGQSSPATILSSLASIPLLESTCGTVIIEGRRARAVPRSLTASPLSHCVVRWWCRLSRGGECA